MGRLMGRAQKEAKVRLMTYAPTTWKPTRGGGGGVKLTRSAVRVGGRDTLGTLSFATDLRFHGFMQNLLDSSPTAAAPVKG